MARQMDFIEQPKGNPSEKPAGRARASTGGGSAAPEPEADSADFGDVAHLAKKGLRVVPVVTGAVVDASGSFLFYLDGHDDARSGVQSQINHLLDSGPAREEHLAPARARARHLLERLTRPR